jgi:ubiquinone/menaquinone biosynthesis C-methylase UbiE
MNFDDKAKDWDKDPKKVERAKIFAEEIVRVLGDFKANSAIEFGSGTGLVSFQLKNRFTSVTLADTSKGMIGVLNEKVKSENLKHFNPVLISETTDLLSYKGIDVIYTLLTLHHVKDIDSAFSVLGKIIAAGGYLFIGDLLTEDGSFHYNNPEFDGHFGFDTAMLKEKLKNESFECIEDRIILSLQKEQDSLVKNYPLFMLSLKKK